MVKLLGIISLILAIVLFPPAALALISNNAVPGDSTYPIKRVLEDGIFAVASLNPVTKAWFAAARSDRRFKEYTVLVTKGKKGEETLNELVEQTQIAATQLNQVKDPVEKEKLKQQLVESIKKYDQGLSQIASNNSNRQPVSAESIQTGNTQSSTPQETPQPVSSDKPLASAIPTPAPTAISTPRSAPVPTPVPTSRPTPVPIPPVVPPGGSSSCDSIRDSVQRARCQLGQIQNNLGTAAQAPNSVPRRSIEVENPDHGGNNNPRSNKNSGREGNVDRESGESGRDRGRNGRGDR